MSFPGGKTDLGEDDLDAAVREAEEEIGKNVVGLELQLKRNIRAFER